MPTATNEKKTPLEMVAARRPPVAWRTSQDPAPQQRISDTWKLTVPRAMAVEARRPARADYEISDIGGTS